MSGFRRLITAGVTLFGISSLWAQNVGSIVGLVTDRTGAAVPNAEVKVISQDTGLVRTLATDATGNFLAAGLPVGTYTVEAGAKGFKTSRKTDITLNIRDQIRVDMQLDVGELTETVEVTAPVVTLQTENAVVGEMVTGTQMVALSTNTRNFLNLAALVPGASSTQPPFNLPVGVSSSASISFNGTRASQNVWRVDGQENYDRGCGGCIAVLPSMDAIAEFKVQTANTEVDTGFGTAGQINVSIKSGTREFHGAFYEFFRNDKLDAANFFTNLAGRPKPHLRLNTFGYNIGGPVKIPGLHKREPRTFFFWSQEWRKLRRGRTFFVPAIPREMRTGDFSSWPRPIRDPATGQPFPGNRIPADRIDPNARILGAPDFLFPLPTLGNFFASSFATPTNVRDEILRIDHHISEKHQVFFRFIFDWVKQTEATTMWTGSTYPTVGTLFTNNPKAFHWQLTSTISPRVVNELSFNFLRQPLNLTPTGNFRRPAELRIPELFPDNRANRMPNIFLSGPALGVNINFGSWPWDNWLNTYHYRNNVILNLGDHTLTFGGQFMPYTKAQDLFGPTQGSFTFDGSVTGHEFADFLLGRAFSYTELSEQTMPKYLTRRGLFWINDTWRVSPKLTLNFGLQWAAMPHAYEDKDRVASFYPERFDPAKAPQVDSAGRIVEGSGDLLNGIGLAGKNGIPRGLVKNHWKLFMPRIGIAWRPVGDNTVIRLGYGMFTEGIQGNDIYNVAPNPPFATTASIFNTALSNPGGGARALFPPNLTIYDFNYNMPQVHQYNFGVQRRIASGVVFWVAYVGTKGTYLQSTRNLNQPFPDGAALVRAGRANVNQVRPYRGYANLMMYYNGTNSNYNSLQMSFRTENYKGLSLQTAYTWSHAIDYVSGDVPGNAHQDSYRPKLERGNSSFDRRHMLVLSYLYDLPFFRNASGALKTVLGGWQVSGITSYQTGTPFSVTLPGDNAGVGGTFYRPDFVRNPNLPGEQRTRERFFDPAAFARPPAGAFGNAGRNTVYGDGLRNWDLSLLKNFAGILGKESTNLQFRLELFNAFNTTQFNGYLTSFGAAGFGSANSARDARSIQLALKLYY